MVEEDEVEHYVETAPMLELATGLNCATTLVDFSPLRVLCAVEVALAGPKNV